MGSKWFKTSLLNITFSPVQCEDVCGQFGGRPGEVETAGSQAPYLTYQTGQDFREC